MHGQIGPDAVRGSVPAPPGAGHHGSQGVPHAEENAPISRIVAEVAAAFPGERITLGDMAEAFGERAFGILSLLLLLPGLLPGMASVFGTPLLILGIQMGLGLRVPKLPGILARQSIKRSDLLRLASASSKGLKKVERYVKPRPGFWTSPYGERIIGWLTAYVAIMLILPGPGTNGPPAFGNIVMALGVIEQDGKVAGWGVALTIAGCVIATAILVLLVWLGVEALGWIF
jgi:hypothetical protein